MNKSKRTCLVNLGAGSLALAVTAGLLVLIQSFYESSSQSFGSHKEPLLFPADVHKRQWPELVPWPQLPSMPDSESNVLELPKASFDLVGSWGGYTHDTTPPDVDSPDHVSVVFGQRGNLVFFATELYSPSDQRIISKPKAWIASPKDVRVTYRAEDEQLDYAYVHRFKLLASGKMSYEETVDFYDRRTHRTVGSVGQRALLHRLTTASEKRFFARPSSRDVFKSELSTSRRIHAR